VYDPVPDFHGPDFFRLKIITADGDTIQLSVYMTVLPVNDAPVAVTDTVTWTGGREITIPFHRLLGNDYDVDGDTIYLTRSVIEKGFQKLDVHSTATAR
jgi:hypothetical protein